MLKNLLTAVLLGNIGIGIFADWYSPTVSVALSQHVAAGDRFMGIRLLGALRLSARPVNNLTPRGLSGLAWDEDDNILYAISDKGELFHIKPVFSDGLLTEASIVAAYPLRNNHHKPLRGRWNDSEGLAIENGANGIAGDAQLIISFEDSPPRIVRYSTTGKWLKDEPLPPSLKQASRYADPNRSLEAVTLHKQWGLLTAPEAPLRAAPAGFVPIAALGRSWLYPLYKAPNSALVAMEALPDGSLLTLERAFVSVWRPLVISLRLTHLPVQSQQPLSVEDVAVFDTSQGWLIDNFEGLTRQRDRRFFMVSDDNSSPLQSTLLVYFELPPAQ